MILSWRRRRAARGTEKTHDTNQDGITTELAIPINFRCPISLELMKDPVTLSTGITYDRENIEKWFESGNNTCPITNRPITNQEPVPNHAIRKMIQDWCVENKSYGFDRIPTPRIPVSSAELTGILGGIEAAAWRGEGGGCLELVGKVKDLATENEKNRRRVVGAGAGRALSETFKAFSDRSTRKHDDLVLLSEILSTLTLMLPLDEEAKSCLGSLSSLNSMIWLLKNGDLSERRTAILVIKDVVSFDQERLNALIKIEGAMEAIVKLIREPICVQTTKASLSIVYNVVIASSKPLPSLNNDTPDQLVLGWNPLRNLTNDVRRKLVDMGLVSLLLETVVDTAERGVSERALAVLDELCGCEEGREKAYESALTVPVLVKKILRVSDMATEFSVSSLWKLSKNEKKKKGEEGDEGISEVAIEALQVGAFQKLLLVLQVGCGEETREKASELLKLLNLFRDKLECVDSMDFKHLKRPF